MLSPRLVLAVFALFSVGNIIASGTGNSVLEWTTKPFLMPLLAAWVWLSFRAAGRSAGDQLDGSGSTAGRPVTPGIIAALLFSAAGDIALLNDGTWWFIAGMALFGCAHASYIITFLGHGALARLRGPLIVVPVGYAIVLVAALVWLWPGLTEIGLAVPMAVYGLLLATTAALSATFGWITGLGGGLFLLSDLLIAVREADALDISGPPIWVMLTYLAAQTLLAAGWVRRNAALQPSPIPA